MTVSRWICVVPAIVTVFTLGASTVEAQQGGIELIAPETLFARGVRVSLSGLYRFEDELFSGANDVPDPLGQEFQEQTHVLGIDYGLRPDITLSLLVPYSRKQLKTRVGAGHLRQSSDGLGDVAFLAKWRVWKHDWHRSAAHVAVFGGLEAPTGDTRDTEDGARLPRKVQSGRGAWNPILGFSANLELDLFRFDYSVLYKINGPGAFDREDGDLFATEVDAAYRFWHEPYPGPSASVKLGVRYSHESHARQSGSRVSNSGNDIVLLRPGMTFHFTPATTVKFGYDYPLYRDYGGTQLALDQRFTFALGIRF